MQPVDSYPSRLLNHFHRKMEEKNILLRKISQLRDMSEEKSMESILLFQEFLESLRKFCYYCNADWHGMYLDNNYIVCQNCGQEKFDPNTLSVVSRSN